MELLGYVVRIATGGRIEGLYRTGLSERHQSHLSPMALAEAPLHQSLYGREVLAGAVAASRRGVGGGSGRSSVTYLDRRTLRRKIAGSLG